MGVEERGHGQLNKALYAVWTEDISSASPNKPHLDHTSLNEPAGARQRQTEAET